MMEKFANHYDGAVALCGPGAGATLRWDTALDIALAYKQVFGWKDLWSKAGSDFDNFLFIAGKTHFVAHLGHQPQAASLFLGFREQASVMQGQ
jgi:hypothetical protein